MLFPVYKIFMMISLLAALSCSLHAVANSHTVILILCVRTTILPTFVYIPIQFFFQHVLVPFHHNYRRTLRKRKAEHEEEKTSEVKPTSETYRLFNLYQSNFLILSRCHSYFLSYEIKSSI